MRKYYIDNLRWMSLLWLIPYHTAMAWNVWGEPNYIFFEKNKLISSIVVFLSPYFMPLLFLLAGISTKYALQKRNFKQYLAERVNKLLIPLLFGTAVLMPILCYFGDKFNCGYNGGFLSHYAVFFTKYTDLTGADGGFSLGQFWFLLYLLIISLAAVGILIPIPKTTVDKSNGINAACHRWTSSPYRQYAFVVRLDIQHFCLSSLSTNILGIGMKIAEKFPIKKPVSFPVVLFLGLPLPILSEILSIGGKSLAEYLYIFLIGYFVFTDEKVTDSAQKYCPILLCAGLGASLLNVYLFIWSDENFNTLNTIAKYISEWFMLISLIGFAKKYFNFNGKTSRYLKSRSFLFYIFHFVWVVVFQYLLHNFFENNTAVLFFGTIIFSCAATFLTCEIVLKIPPICYVTGVKSSPIKKS